MRVKLFLILSVLSCAQANAAVNMEELKPDDVVKTSVSLGERTYPLPAGDWHVIARYSSNGLDWAGNPFPVRNVLLAQYKNKALFSMLRLISSPKNIPGVSRRHEWKDDPCGNLKEVYLKNTLQGNYNLPECLYVKPILGFGLGTGAYWGDANRRIQEAGASIPPVALYVDYNYFRDGGFVHYSVWLNPDIAGIPRDPTRLAIDSKWGVKNITGQYKQFVDQASSWAYQLAASVKSSYKDDFQPIPDLPYPADK